jgi:hypothetical protein
MWPAAPMAVKALHLLSSWWTTTRCCIATWTAGTAGRPSHSPCLSQQPSSFESRLRLHPPLCSFPISATVLVRLQRHLLLQRQRADSDAEAGWKGSRAGSRGRGGRAIVTLLAASTALAFSPLLLIPAAILAIVWHCQGQGGCCGGA